jgi:predicted permease
MAIAHAASHGLAALSLFFKGVNKLEQAREDWGIIAFFWLTAASFLFVAVYHERLLRQRPRITVIIAWLEAAVCVVVASLYFHEGKSGLPWVWLIAAAGSVVHGIVRLQRLRRG